MKPLNGMWLLAAMSILGRGQLLADDKANAMRPELELKESFIGEREYELSGMAVWKDVTLIVSDNNKDTEISEIRAQRGRFLMEPRIDLTQLQGFKDFQTDAVAKAKTLGHDKWFDLEGIAACGDILYLVNERIRQVVRVDRQSIRGLNIDWTIAPQIMEGDANAGLEGVAVDCAADQLWVAKERDPRGIITVDLKTLRAVAWTDIPGSDRQGQKVLEFREGRGLMEIGPDFGDLQFYEGFLYALERNTYEIAKIDPKTMTLVSRVSYFKSAIGMYDTGEPFGVAEGLLIGKDTISVGMDNNGSPLATRSVAKYRVSGPLPGILKFARPKQPKF